MGIIRRPDKIVGTDVLNNLRGHCFVWISRHETLAVEIFTRLHFELGAAFHGNVFVVHAVEPRGNPIRAGLQHGAFHTRIFVEHGKGHHLRESRHHVNRQKRKVEETKIRAWTHPFAKAIMFLLTPCLMGIYDERLL